MAKLGESPGLRAGCLPGQGVRGPPMSLRAAADIAGVQPVELGRFHCRAADTTEGSS